LIGCGKKGNEKLKKTVTLRINEYLRASMKAEKPQILSSTVSNIRNAPGRFIKQDSDTKQ